MKIKASNVARRNKEAYERGAHIIANKGGTRSAKTWSILIILLYIAQKATSKILISVVSATLPHLKKGAIRDFDILLSSMGLVKGRDYDKNESDQLYTFGNGQIEFFGCENAGKVHGPQRNILFINEANRIKYEVYRQLAIRTDGTIFLDWNPTTTFWYDDNLANRDDVCEIHSTYLDNPFLSDTQVREIESNKSDEKWWRVYGLGLTGQISGLVYTNWDLIENDAMPALKDCKVACLGLDLASPTIQPRVLMSVLHMASYG